MARIKFKSVRFRQASIDIIDQCNAVIRNYMAQGLRLTLRQLYYQLVTVNAITNEEKSYRNLGAIVSDARLAGMMDWNAIEDRVRQPRSPSEWDSLSDLAESALDAYRLPRWADQEFYAELWVEKDALAGVLEPLASEHHVTLMVNRGYSSQSAMFEAAQRFTRRCLATEEEIEAGAGTGEFNDGPWQAWPEGPEEDGGEPVALARKPVLFYLGDHDPSGEDMVRDIRDRLSMFGIDVDVRKIALTTDQVKRYNPPPNPAKVTDSRAAAYIAKHGPVSWEVDALPPNVLARVVRSAFAEVIDEEKMDAIKAREETHKTKLRKAVEKIDG